MHDRTITLDGDEIEEIKDTDKAMYVRKYINGELVELRIEAQT